MPKRRQRQQPRHSPPPPPPPRGVDGLRIATSIALAVVLVVSILNLRTTDRIEESLERRLERVEDRIARVGERIADPPGQPAAPPQSPSPRRGPDPDRVYTIRTAGAPAKGPSTAPVTIAEFSDFQ